MTRTASRAAASQLSAAKSSTMSAMAPCQPKLPAASRVSGSTMPSALSVLMSPGTVCASTSMSEARRPMLF